MDYKGTPSEKKLSFAMPEGLELPQGTAENGTVELIATFKLEAGGMMCLKGVEGIPIKDEKPTEQVDPAKDDQASFTGAVEKGL